MMAHLSLAFLGPPVFTLDRFPVTGFKASKAKALLVYLAVEADRPHRRETLATLLWPNRPDRTARTNLRRALSDLRRAVGDHYIEPPFLSISRDAIQFNNRGAYRGCGM